MVDGIIFGVVLMGIILCTCWMVALMYRSFSISCNVKGGKAIGTFIGGLVVAEVLSQLCIWPLVTHAGAPVSNTAALSGQSVGVESSIDNELTASATRFVDLLMEQDFAAAVAQFDSAMKAALPQAKLQEHWRALLKDSGAFKEQLGTRTESRGGYRIVFVTCKFERAIVDMKVVFNAQRQITGFFYVPGRAPRGSRSDVRRQRATSLSWRKPSPIAGDHWRVNV